MAAMEVPLEMGQGVLGLGLLYAIMLLGSKRGLFLKANESRSMAEYIYHRYFQHLGLNKLGPAALI